MKKYGNKHNKMIPSINRRLKKKQEIFKTYDKEMKLGLT